VTIENISALPMESAEKIVEKGSGFRSKLAAMMGISLMVMAAVQSV